MKKLSLCALTALVGSSLALGLAPQLPASAATTASASLVATGIGGSSANSGVGDSGLGQAWGVNTTLVGSTRWTVFESAASNLVENDTNNASDIFVTDGTTIKRLSTSASGEQGSNLANSYDPTICGNGRYVAFTTENEWGTTDANGAEDVYVIDRDADNDQVMDEFSQSSPSAGVTTNLVSQSYNSDTGEYDISYLGANSGVISDDCTKVAFVTDMDFTMDDLNFGPDVYVRDLTSATTPVTWATQFASDGSSGGGFLPAISGNGSKVVVTTEATDLVSGDGTVGGLVMRSAGVGRYLTIKPNGTVSPGTLADSERPAAITPDGTCVAFKADKGFDLVAGFPAVSQGIFLWDNRTGTPTVSLVSQAYDGFELSSASNPRISDDCRFVAYQTGDDVVVNETIDTNSKSDVYLYDTVKASTVLISATDQGVSANGVSSVAALDWDPTTNDGVVLVMSSASNIGGANGGNSTIDLFSVPFSVTNVLSVTQVGNGAVSSNPSGISLSAAGTDTGTFDALDTVVLTATPDSGWQFDGWTGACTGTSTCSVTMSEARTVTATFTAEVATSGGMTSLSAPVRLLDTRGSGNKVGKTDGTGTPYELTVAGVSGVPGTGVAAVAMNVTVAEGEATAAGGYVTVYPCGTRPNSSNLNFVNGQTVPNAVVAPLSNAGKVCFYVYGKAHLLADVSGYFTAGFSALSAPTRLLDTRGSGNKVGKTDGTGTAYELTVAGSSGLPAAGTLGTVAMNVTVAEGEATAAGGYVTVYPCGTRPNSSNLNFVNGQTVPNAVIASVSATGKVCFYVYGKAHLLVDVAGYFS